MQIISPDLISGKKVLLRYDIDVPIDNGRVVEDFRLKAGLPTLRLCLEHAEQVVMMGHIGRPGGKEVPELSVEPIYDWLAQYDDLRSHMSSGKLKLLENLRFEAGEEACDLDYARELVSYGDFYVNEAFAAHHKATSTTVLPTLLPHAAGLRFAEEVRRLTEVRENPKRPLVVIIGGVKIEDKLPVIEAMSKIADYVLVGGKIVLELLHSFNGRTINIKVASLNQNGTDIDEKTLREWEPIIKTAGMIVWNGPVGKVEEEQYSKGTKEIAGAIISSGSESIIGGGDTIGILGKLGLLGEIDFVSVGGGGMLKFLADGTLPTIEALR